MNDIVSTDFLYARPSFLSGLARAFDLWTSFDRYNTSQTADEADWWALENDLEMVRQELRMAAAAFLAQNPELADEIETLLSSSAKGRRNLRANGTSGILACDEQTQVTEPSR